jgi:hypothetical protein
MAKLTATEIDAITIEIVNRLQNENEKTLVQMKEEFESSSHYETLSALINEYNNIVDRVDTLKVQLRDVCNCILPYRSNLDNISLENIIKEHIRSNEYISPSGLKLHKIKKSEIRNKVVLANLSTNGKVDIEELIAEIVVNL